MVIVKREGQKEEFNSEKIKKAIEAAFKSVGYSIDNYDELVDSVAVWDGMNIEDIQDQVIETLRNFDYNDVADAYLIYRYKHKHARELAESKKRFIQKYKESSNTANATVDDNSNVAGKINVYLDKKEIGQVPIYKKAQKKKENFFQKIKNLFIR